MSINNQLKFALKLVLIMIKQNCTYCGKSVTRLDRHMQTIHKISLQRLPPPTNLKDFATLLAQFPLSHEEWNYLLLNRKHMEKFIKEGEELPSDVCKVLYLGLQQYSANPLKLALVLEKKPDTKDISLIDKVGQFVKESVNNPILIKRLNKSSKHYVRSYRKKKST